MMKYYTSQSALITADMIEAASTHIEDACSEKTKMLPKEYTRNLRIMKNEAAFLSSFADIKPVHRSLFDY